MIVAAYALPFVTHCSPLYSSLPARSWSRYQICSRLVTIHREWKQNFELESNCIYYKQAELKLKDLKYYRCDPLNIPCFLLICIFPTCCCHRKPCRMNQRQRLCLFMKFFNFLVSMRTKSFASLDL
jgi:hypothetical protein